MGNKISKERLEMIRALKLAYISEKISDLSDEYGQSAGTKVEILIFKRSSKEIKVGYEIARIDNR